MARRATSLVVPQNVGHDQRRAADPLSSAWVAASAGTGKTKVLTDRVLRLLLAGSKPMEILCLTFTKAAAAEMANRIAARLARWATLPTEAPGDLPSLTQEFRELGITDMYQRDFDRARTLFAAMLDCAGGMKIQTIHSFCQSLLARFPLEAGLPPGFNVLDDRQAADLARQTFEDTMETVGRDARQPFALALASLLRQVGDKTLRRLLMKNVIEQREKILTGKLPQQLAQLAAELGVNPLAGIADILADAVENIPADALRELAHLAAGSDKKTDSDFARGIHAFLALEPSVQAEQWDDYADIFLIQKGPVKKTLLTQQVAKAAPQLFDQAQQEAQRVCRLRDRMQKVRLLDINRDFYTVAREWLGKLAGIKRRQASLDFNDLIAHTRTLLAQPERAAWILYKLGYEVRHILVDEAQDTSLAQWDIVGRLTDEFFAGQGAVEAQTLFVVGDEKQSIFSFNGADPAAFIAKRHDYAASAAAVDAPWADVPLSLSFRSTGAVLNLVNEVFAADEVREGVSQEPFAQAPARAHDAGLVEYWPPLEHSGEKQEKPEEWVLPLKREGQSTPTIQLARLIAGRIRTWLDTGEQLAAHGRPIAAGDIMVLVPRRTVFFPQLVRALKEKNIPVAGVDRMVLTDQLAVQDLLALLNFLALPEDDLNLATLLKAPFIALGEEDLFALCHRRGGTVWEALEARRLDEPFATIHDWLTALRNAVDQMRPYELLQRIVNGPCPARPGGSVREALWQRLGEDALDPMGELLAEALRFEATQLPTLQHFIAWLTEDEIQKKRELMQAAGQVRIMTAHASKGLEAPIVFVVDLPKDREATEVLLPGAPDAPLLFMPRADYKEDIAAGRQLLARRAQAEERRRLLYVALTRAEDRLYICGAYPKKTPLQPWSPVLEAALGRLGQEAAPSAAEVDLGLVRIIRYETEQQVVPVATAASAAIAAPQPLPAWALTPIMPPKGLARPLAPSRIAEPHLAVMSPGGPDAIRRFQRGNLTHKLLQYLPDAPPANRRAAASAYLLRHAVDVSDELRAGIVDEVMAILDDPAYADLFGPASRAEVPLVGVVGAHPISGQVDRLLVTADTVQIVDYKTNRPPPREAAAVADAYKVQMAYYAALLQQIYPGKAIAALLLWTDGARLMELPPELLQPFLPAGVTLRQA